MSENEFGEHELHSEKLGMIKVVDRVCPSCQTVNEEVPPGLYSYDCWPVIECSSCGFVYITKGPVYDELSQNLAWEMTSQLENDRRAKLRKTFYKASKLSRWRLHIFPRKKITDMIERFSAPGPVVDVGCGTGCQLSDLPPDYIPWGIEISEQLAADAHELFSQKGGECVRAPALDGLQQLQDDHYTAISMRSYLEHEARPLEVLVHSYRILKAGGVVIVKVPNFASLNRRLTGKKWVGFRYPDHLNYFTPKSLKTMAKKAGFEEVFFGLTYCLPTSDNFYAILKKSG